MPFKSIDSDLRKLINEQCLATLDAGGGEARDVALTIYQAHTDKCQEASKALILAALTKIAREVFKSWTAKSLGASQLSLDGMSADTVEFLPHAVAIPKGNGRFLFKAIVGENAATVEELEMAAMALHKQVMADQKRYNALLEYIEYRKYRPAA